MDIKSNSSSTGDAQRKSSNVSHSSTGASQATLPMRGASSSQGTTPVSDPTVQSSLGDPSLQPSALVFHSGIAFDYDNFPQILSVCWPVFNTQSGMSVIARDGPERGITQIATNEIITANNHVTVASGPFFTWDQPHNEPVAKDPVISTPDKKTPIGITVCNSCEVRTEMVTSNAADGVINTSVPQQNTTSVPPLGICQSKKQGACYGPTELTTLLNVQSSGEKNLKEASFDKVQSFESEEATVSKVLGRKRARNKAVNVTLRLPDDNKQSAPEARDITDPENNKKEKPDHTCCSTVPIERLDGSDCERDTVAASRGSGIFMSSIENKQEKEGKTDCKPTAGISPMIASSKVKATGDAPIATEDHADSAANVIDLSDDSYVFSFSPLHQSDSNSNHSTGNVQQSVLETGNDKEEDVRDLITRIRYIKSRLHRAESDYRKKRMLKTIVGLQKRVKALVKGMHKVKEGMTHRQQESNNHSGALSSKESVENNNDTDLGSQRTDMADRELATNDVIMDEGGMLLLNDAHQPSNDSSKDTTERKCEDQYNGEELTVETPSATIVHHSTDAPNSKTNIADDLKSTTSCNPIDGDIIGKNNSIREDRGSLSLVDSNGVDDLSLRLPYEIGLDCSPCGKRAASLSDAAKSDLQKSHSTTAKKMKTSCFSDEAVNGSGTRFEDATHHVCNVTQDGAREGLVSNERNEDTNDVKPSETNASSYEMTDLLVRKEFFLSDTEDETQLNSTDAARAITAENSREVPLTLLGDEVQLELEEGCNGKDRQANEEFGKDCTTVFGGIDSTDGASSLTCNDNKGNTDVEMDEIQPECTQISENNPSSEEAQEIAFNLRSVEDKPSEFEEEHCISSLERVLQDDDTQGFTSPAIHNPSGRQEDVDLTQSLLIREARILNLTRKRDRLLNLTGFKLK